MPKKNHAPRPWTPIDVKRLRKFARQRFSQRETADILGRSRGALAFKAMRLGIRFRAVEQPVGTQKRVARARARAAARR